MVLDLMPSPGPFPSGMTFTGGGRLLLADVDGRAVDALEVATLPQTVRRDPREERVVLRRRITNRGPDALARADVWIALPHDAPNQQLHGEPELTPRPSEIIEDQWGQRFAHFEVAELPAGESFEVEMTTHATLYGMRHHIDPANVGSLDGIPGEVRAYLEDASKYALDHPSIRRHLEDALQGETRPYWMARKIARYIQERMHYELVGGWNIAPTVIDRGSGSCSEYSFVFIAMCRAAGIPARYVGSLVVRGDDASTDEVFHRWPEIYLPGYGWVPFDVQGGDKPEPAERGEALGSLSNRFLITTWGGGASDVLGWDYNSTASWICRGRCHVDDLHIGDWYPAASAADPEP
jgi:transglutaminase-like putative cysteine protease